MKSTVHGHGVEVTDTLRAYAEKKLQKLLKYFSNIQTADIELEFRPIHEAARRQVAQITLSAKGTLLRAEERSGDMYSSIDMAFHKLENQIKKYKEKRILAKRRDLQKQKRIYRGTKPVPMPIVERDEDQAISRVKQIPMKPISPEEAVQEMEFVGHDFYVFRNSESKNINVIYRRRNGEFGLIEPEA